jgi:Xaa-Pro aminopeptidase
MNHLTDLYYYTGSIQNGVLLIPSAEKPTYYVKRSMKRAEAESPLKILPYPGRKSLLKKIKDILGDDGQLGLALNVTPASVYHWLSGNIGNPIVDINRIILYQKAIKSAWEIRQIEKAADQATALFREMDKHLRAGISEIEMSASIEQHLRLLGHGGTIRVRVPNGEVNLPMAVSGDSALYPTLFDGPVGAEGAYPSACPGAGWKKIKTGETVMIDVVTSYNGYHSDQSRIFCVGDKIPTKALEAHTFCLKTLKKLEKHMKPGANCSDIYKAVRAWTEEHDPPEGFMGYGEKNVKFFGHGIGLELDEFPIIAQKIDMELKPNMIIAVEPKAFLRGIGPVGVENTYQITESSFKNLCPFNTDIVGIR